MQNYLYIIKVRQRVGGFYVTLTALNHFLRANGILGKNVVERFRIGTADGEWLLQVEHEHLPTRVAFYLSPSHDKRLMNAQEERFGQLHEQRGERALRGHLPVGSEMKADVVVEGFKIDDVVEGYDHILIVRLHGDGVLVKQFILIGTPCDATHGVLKA